MQVTVFEVEVVINGRPEWIYLVSDGHGPVIEVGSASVAGAVARSMNLTDGIETDALNAEMWLRNGARLRKYVQAEDVELLEEGAAIQALVEQDGEGRRSRRALYVATDADGIAITLASHDRADVERGLGSRAPVI